MICRWIENRWNGLLNLKGNKEKKKKKRKSRYRETNNVSGGGSVVTTNRMKEKKKDNHATPMETSDEEAQSMDTIGKFC